MSDKKVLIEVDNVRIKEYDKLNVTIERLEWVYNPKTKQKAQKWVFKGYSATIFKAMQKIIRDELLIDYEVIDSVEWYVEQVINANKRAVESMRRGRNE